MLNKSYVIFTVCVNVLILNIMMLCNSLCVYVLQSLFPVISSTVCMNEARALQVDAAVAADFKGCCNDSALVRALHHTALIFNSTSHM